MLSGPTNETTVFSKSTSFSANVTFICEKVSLTSIALSMERLRNGSVTVSTVSIDGYCVSNDSGNVCMYRSPVKSTKNTKIAYSPSAVPLRGIAVSVLHVNRLLTASCSTFASGTIVPFALVTIILESSKFIPVPI